LSAAEDQITKLPEGRLSLSIVEPCMGNVEHSSNIPVTVSEPAISVDTN